MPKDTDIYPTILNHPPGSHFLASRAHVVARGILEPFQKRARAKGDPARLINDRLRETGCPLMSTYLVNRNKRGVDTIQAEFLAALGEERTLVGPVATAGRIKRDEVFKYRVVLLARFSTHFGIQPGALFALSVPNTHDDERALAGLGFDLEPDATPAVKAAFAELVAGAPVTITRFDRTRTVPLNLGLSWGANRRSSWTAQLDGSISLGPSAHLSAKLSRGASNDEP